MSSDTQLKLFKFLEQEFNVIALDTDLDQIENIILADLGLEYNSEFDTYIDTKQPPDEPQ